MIVLIHLKTSHEIIYEVRYSYLFSNKRNKIKQFIKTLNTIWSFEFIDNCNDKIYRKRGK